MNFNSGNSPKVNPIDVWAENFASQEETQFFNSIRLYLGEVHTPFNKQKLTSQLALFIKKPENTRAILSLLDEMDITILSAISLIPKASEKILTEFFSNTYTYSDLYSCLCNLRDRLLIYAVKEEYSDNQLYCLNPLLEESLKPYLSLSKLLPSPTVAQYSYDDIFSLTPNFMASLISYLKIHGCSCKADGVIKKNDLNRLEEIFGGKLNCLQLLVTAFINLSLLKDGEKSLILDLKRLENFVSLSELQQYTLLCAASVSRFSRDGLKREAQLLVDCFSAISEKGLTRNSILRLAFLTGSYAEEGTSITSQSRFSKILQQARVNADNESIQNANLLDRMIDSAIEMGLLQKAGTTEAGEAVYVKSGIFTAVQNDDLLNGVREEQLPNVLNIESTFSITLMPGLNLQKLLPFTSFMSIKKFGIVTEFELTKNSVAYAFDKDWTPEKIFEILKKYTSYDLPQNLIMNVQDWYNSYSSAILYNGYVLKVCEKNVQLVENAPNIKKYIKEKLADGVYFLNLPSNVDISVFKNQSGLEFMGNLKVPSVENEVLNFPVLRSAKKISVLENANQNVMEISGSERNEILEKLRKHLEQMDADKNRKESLEHRINARLILNENQLETASIRTEILEADGMDYGGKIHLLEAAMSVENMVEIQLPNADGKVFFKLTGRVLSLAKQIGDAVLSIQIEPEKNIEHILVSRITHLRRLRF